MESSRRSGKDNPRQESMLRKERPPMRTNHLAKVMTIMKIPSGVKNAPVQHLTPPAAMTATAMNTAVKDATITAIQSATVVSINIIAVMTVTETLAARTVTRGDVKKIHMPCIRIVKRSVVVPALT